MNTKKKYYLVEKEILSEAILKVMEAKALLDQGKVKYVSEAVKAVGISRSVFYKYHESVRPFFEHEFHSTITLGMELLDDPGVLGDVLSRLATYEINVLTINQTIPIAHVANVTITFETLNMDVNVDKLIRELENHKSIRKVSVLARE
ncbi:MAG: ACT domain-containing protein [Erysipelothrix sp.]|nr:ACT domain-containing protein [Erysipelothrix sp.]